MRCSRKLYTMKLYRPTMFQRLTFQKEENSKKKPGMDISGNDLDIRCFISYSHFYIIQLRFTNAKFSIEIRSVYKCYVNLFNLYIKPLSPFRTVIRVHLIWPILYFGLSGDSLLNDFVISEF